MTLHVVAEPSHPSWGAVWDADDLSDYLGIARDTLYRACRRGEWDDCQIRGVGSHLKFAGPRLASRFGVNDFPDEREGGDELAGSPALGPRD